MNEDYAKRLSRGARAWNGQAVRFGEVEIVILWQRAALRLDGTIAGSLETRSGSGLSTKLRQLRSTLLSLESDNRAAIAKWLDAAGSMRLRANPLKRKGAFKEADVDVWTDDSLTDEVISLVRRSKRLHEWLLTLQRKDFAEFLRTFHSLAKDQSFESNSITYQQFRENLMRGFPIPTNVDLDTLIDFVFDSSIQAQFQAQVEFNIDREPRFSFEVPNAFRALNLLTFVDLKYLERALAKCQRCQKEFVLVHQNERFCSATCRNYLNTQTRRLKLRSVNQGLRAWNSLTDQKRERAGDYHQWISDWAKNDLTENTGKQVDIDASWVKTVLDNSKEH
jgi:hypothetical protein